MKFTALLSTLAAVLAADLAAEPTVNEDHLDIALDLAKEQGTTIAVREVDDELATLDKRGFLLLAKLKWLWAMKMGSYNICYQCGGNICGSTCCSCGSPTNYKCSNC